MRRCALILIALCLLASPAMAANWYVHGGDGSTTAYWAIPVWSAGATKAVGDLVRQTAPAVGSERVFICTVAGTTHATTEPTWTTTKGAKQSSDNGVIWQECTGNAALNNDLANVPASSTVRSVNPGVGRIIKNNSETHYFICDTAGTTGSGEPTFDTDAGDPTTDSSCTWRCLGPVGNFVTRWAAPFPRLQTAVSSNFTAAGDIIYVSASHTESQSSTMTCTAAGTAPNPTRVLCIDHSAEPKELATGATIATTGASSIAINGHIIAYGLKFNIGTGSSAASFVFNNGSTISIQKFESCEFNLATTSESARFNQSTFGSAWNFAECVNCTFTFGDTGQGFYPFLGSLKFVGGSMAASGTVPNTLIASSASKGPVVTFCNVDLSALSSKTLVTHSIGQWYQYDFLNCRLGTSVTLATGTASPRGGRARIINSDSGAANTRYEVSAYEGSAFSETTIVRSGGATNGSTSFSQRIDSSANASVALPFTSDPIYVWNETTGSPVDVTVEIISFGSAALDDDDVWVEADYLGNSSYPLASRISDRGGNILTDSTTDQATSTATWTGTARQNSQTYAQNAIISVQGKLFIKTNSGSHSSAGSEPAGYATANDGDSVTDGSCTFRAGYRQKLVVSPTPQMKGPIAARVCLAKASTTVYFCPKVADNADGREWMVMSPMGINSYDEGSPPEPPTSNSNFLPLLSKLAPERTWEGVDHDPRHSPFAILGAIAP